jgi:hypothetical protein
MGTTGPTANLAPEMTRAVGHQTIAEGFFVDDVEAYVIDELDRSDFDQAHARA